MFKILEHLLYIHIHVSDIASRKHFVSTLKPKPDLCYICFYPSHLRIMLRVVSKVTIDRRKALHLCDVITQDGLETKSHSVIVMYEYIP